MEFIETLGTAVSGAGAGSISLSKLSWAANVQQSIQERIGILADSTRTKDVNSLMFDGKNVCVCARVFYHSSDTLVPLTSSQ